MVTDLANLSGTIRILYHHIFPKGSSDINLLWEFHSNGSWGKLSFEFKVSSLPSNKLLPSDVHVRLSVNQKANLSLPVVYHINNSLTSYDLSRWNSLGLKNYYFIYYVPILCASGPVVREIKSRAGRQIETLQKEPCNQYRSVTMATRENPAHPYTRTRTHKGYRWEQNRPVTLDLLREIAHSHTRTCSAHRIPNEHGLLQQPLNEFCATFFTPFQFFPRNVFNLLLVRHMAPIGLRRITF